MFFSRNHFRTLQKHFSSFFMYFHVFFIKLNAWPSIHTRERDHVRLQYFAYLNKKKNVTNLPYGTIVSKSGPPTETTILTGSCVACGGASTCLPICLRTTKSHQKQTCVPFVIRIVVVIVEASVCLKGTTVSRSGAPTKTTIYNVFRGHLRRRNQIKGRQSER